MPTEAGEVILKGKVSMEMLSGIGLQDIEVRLIPAKTAYELFLSGKRMDLNDLKLWE